MMPSDFQKLKEQHKKLGEVITQGEELLYDLKQLEQLRKEIFEGEEL